MAKMIIHYPDDMTDPDVMHYITQKICAGKISNNIHGPMYCFLSTHTEQDGSEVRISTEPTRKESSKSQKTVTFKITKDKK